MVKSVKLKIPSRHGLMFEDGQVDGDHKLMGRKGGVGNLVEGHFEGIAQSQMAFELELTIEPDSTEVSE